MSATLSVVVPVYNEKDTVLKIIDKVLKLDIVKELILVDDRSTDGTRELLKSTKFDGRVKLLLHDKNMGKGAAIRTGFKNVSQDVAVIQDADLEYDPNELNDMIKPIADGVADVVYGSRLSGGKPQRVHLFWHRVGNDFLTFLTNLLYNTTLSDMETCYKMFKSDVLKSLDLRSNGFDIEPEITAKVLKKKYRIYEVPINFYGRSYDEGKKIKTIDGFIALWTLFKYRIV
jgi:glycosyltransferase involved in cell wall biosynthesis